MHRTALRLALGVAAVLPGAMAAGADRAKIIAHRGASEIAPENTLAAFELAWKLEADGVEGDFRLTKDRQIVCFHDAQTARTTNGNLVVANATLAELQQLDAGSWKHARWSGQRIPTLSEVLQTVPAGKTMLIEIKSGAEIVPYLKLVVEREEFSKIEMHVISFDRQVIADCKQQMPQVQAFWITKFRRDAEHRWRPTADEILETLRELRADGLDCQSHRQAVNELLAQRLRERGLSLHNWTVNDGAEAVRLQKLGGASLTTDRPDLLRPFLLTPELAQHVVQYHPLDGEREQREGGEGTPLKVEATDWVQGVFGKGLKAAALQSGIETTIEMPPRGAISMWHHPQSWTPEQVLWEVGTSEEALWQLALSAEGQLAVRAPHGSLEHQMNPRTGLNRWHHILVTWDAEDRGRSAVELYVEGVRVAFAPWYTPDHPTPRATKLRWLPPQRDQAGNLVPAHGLIDDLMFFNNRLTAGDTYRVMHGDFSKTMPNNTTPNKKTPE